MPKRTDISKVLRFVGVLLSLTATGHACWEGCTIVPSGGSSFRLLDRKGHPIPKASIVVRKAPELEYGQPHRVCGSVLGPIVSELRTDQSGLFTVGLSGRFWITYMDAKNGESFLVEIENAKKGKPTELAIDRFGGRCYLIDVERNATKPEGWPRPLDQDRAAEVMKQKK